MKVPLHELRVGNASGEVSCTPCKDCKFNPDEQMHTTEILIKKENNSERRRNQLVPRAQKEATKNILIQMSSTCILPSRAGGWQADRGASSGLG